MSILSLIKKVCVQDAVYWPYESNTGYEPSYGAPQSIKCRWDGSSEVLTDKQGKQIVASAEILCPTKFTVFLSVKMSKQLSCFLVVYDRISTIRCQRICLIRLYRSTAV